MNSRRNNKHSPKRFLSRKLGIALVVIGILVGLVPIFTIMYGRYQQNLLYKKAEAKMQSEREKLLLSAKKTEALLRTTPKGRAGAWPITKIIIPKLGVDQFVQEGIDAKTLTQSPGHYPGTKNPGQTGWCAIAGHRITFSAPFDRLNEMTKGDEIILETAEARFVYLFETIKTVSDKADLNLYMPRTNKAQIILTTCEPKTGSSHRLIASGTLAPYPASRYVVLPAE